MSERCFEYFLFTPHYHKIQFIMCTPRAFVLALCECVVQVGLREEEERKNTEKIVSARFRLHKLHCQPNAEHDENIFSVHYIHHRQALAGGGGKLSACYARINNNAILSPRRAAELTGNNMRETNDRAASSVFGACMAIRVPEWRYVVWYMLPHSMHGVQYIQCHPGSNEVIRIWV